MFHEALTHIYRNMSLFTLECLYSWLCRKLWTQLRLRNFALTWAAATHLARFHYQFRVCFFFFSFASSFCHCLTFWLPNTFQRKKGWLKKYSIWKQVIITLTVICLSYSQYFILQLCILFSRGMPRCSVDLISCLPEEARLISTRFICHRYLRNLRFSVYSMPRTSCSSV